MTRPMLQWRLLPYLPVPTGSGRDGLCRFCREITPAVRTVHPLPIENPLVSWGRIARAVWLRLSRSGNELRAYISQDGNSWAEAGTTMVTNGPVLAGCFACSGLGSISAQVTFEHVTLTRP